MKVVLLQDVRGQGKKGQLLNVSDGYARNYLLPRKLAAEATRDVLNAMEQHDEAVRRRAEEDLARARLLAKDLEGITVRIQMKAGANGKLYGAVTAREIAAAMLEQKNIEIDHRKIVLDEPIKNFGNYEIKAKLFPQVTGKFFLTVTE
ncbi:MAG: 50S ribosomal protein L9 [Clostridiaceae bacterium]|nr:50S ribosomal protein L9 [Clostridiaceae bacterium]MDD6274815.1 50S ribosomal protein L9 [Clostridiaceae bacterium]